MRVARVSWARTLWAKVQAVIAQKFATREGRAAPVPVPQAVQDLPRARAANGKVVLVRCANRAELRAAARFERRQFGVPFDRATHLLRVAFPTRKPHRS